MGEIEIEENKFGFMRVGKTSDLMKDSLKGLELDDIVLHHQGIPLAGDAHIKPPGPCKELAGVIPTLADTASIVFIGRCIVTAGYV
jgi:hypothetical protein